MAERIIAPSHRRRSQAHRRRASAWASWVWPAVVVCSWLLLGMALGGMLVLSAVDALLDGRCW